MTARPAARRKRKLPSPSLFVWAGLEAAPRAAAPRQFDQKKITEIARAIWRAGGDPHGSLLVEEHFASRGIVLPDDIGTDVVRFHSSLKLGEHRAAGLIWLLRDVHSDEPTGILRQYIDEDATLIGRRTLGRVYSSAVKLTDDADVTTGLHLASSIEQGIRAMSHGYRPMWALTGANALADFAVLDGIEALTVIGDADDDSTRAVAARWRNAGREVLHVQPRGPP